MDLVIHSNLRREELSIVEFQAYLTSSFDRLQHLIEKISVKISDMNGPKGGRDKRCSLQLFLLSGGQQIVTDDAEDVRTALVRAAERARSKLASAMSRKRTLVRRRGRRAKSF